ncbi:MAG: serine O-acetyltransferase, partial [Phocaeicola sp.]
MNKIIKQDLYRYEGNRCESLRIQLRYFFFVPGFTYIYFFRRVQLSKNVLIKAFFYFFLKVTSYITHIQIPPSTNIKEGF